MKSLGDQFKEIARKAISDKRRMTAERALQSAKSMGIDARLVEADNGYKLVFPAANINNIEEVTAKIVESASKEQ